MYYPKTTTKIHFIFTSLDLTCLMSKIGLSLIKIFLRGKKKSVNHENVNHPAHFLTTYKKKPPRWREQSPKFIQLSFTMIIVIVVMYTMVTIGVFRPLMSAWPPRLHILLAGLTSTTCEPPSQTTWLSTHESH